MYLAPCLISCKDRNNVWQATKRGSGIEQAVDAINHGSLVEVSDPTGHLPEGLVFLTGFGERAPSRTFLTRVSVLTSTLQHLYFHLTFVYCFFSRHALKARTELLQE